MWIKCQSYKPFTKLKHEKMPFILMGRAVEPHVNTRAQRKLEASSMQELEAEPCSLQC